MSVEIVKMVGEVIFERFLCFGSLKVNFDYLMVIFRVEFVGEVFFFGIDIIGDSLFYKRFWCVYDYFVYFKVSIVNVFIELVELNGGLFIDFFCGSGMILIEFVFRGYKGRIIGFEKYRKYIRGVEMNVLLVGVFDKIEFIQGDVIKFFQYVESVDFVVSNFFYGLKIGWKSMILRFYMVFFSEFFKVFEKCGVFIMMEKKVIERVILDNGFKIKYY